MRAYDLSAGLFIRGLNNLATQLAKAAEHAAASGVGETALLSAKLAVDAQGDGGPGFAPADLHAYTLAAHTHWAAEGAGLAIAHLLGSPRAPLLTDATSFANLHRRLDATIAHLRGIDPEALEAGLGRVVVIEHRRGSVSASGERFLVAFAVPHFFYHVTTAYGILRNQGVPLTMSDFLGDWGMS